MKRRVKKKTGRIIVGRILLCLGTLVLFIVAAAFSLGLVLARGPSVTVRDALVLSAMQASATKWAPGLFLSQQTVDSIIADSEVETVKKVSADDYSPPADKDEWDKAVDGMIFETFQGDTYKAYILLVKDPSRVYTGPTFDYSSAYQGKNVFEAAEMENAIAVINGGEFIDRGGTGDGGQPMGTTYSKGKLVWYDGDTSGTFIGFDKDNRLVATEGMTKEKGARLNIRDGVMFKSGNVLIDNDGENVSFHYSDRNTGVAQRTSIGQRKDGTVILIVTDGRTASSLGATKNDMVDLMKQYGAVTAGYLDGGSSSVMYYDKYYDKYGIDADSLDQYQLQGLVNNYKAFTPPRHIPTFFLVAREGAAQ